MQNGHRAIANSLWIAETHLDLRKINLYSSFQEAQCGWLQNCSRLLFGETNTPNLSPQHVVSFCIVLVT